MTPTREIYFNITHVWVIYVLLAVAMSVFAKGWYGLLRLWRQGKSADRVQPVGARLSTALKQVFSQQTLLRRYRTAGIFHALFFWGFVILFLATTVVFIHEDLRIHIMQGWFYLVFQSLIVDLFGAFAIIGILMALAYRYLYKARRLKPDTRDDALMLVVILVILVTGYVIEGLRIELTHDPWAAWSPVGRAAGVVMAAFLNADTMRALHRATWWFHAVVVFSFIAWIPYSKLRHLFTSPANIYLQNLGPKGVLLPVDLEKAENLGISRLEQFTWKDLFDLDSCTECGRCEVNCPAFLTSKPLSPKRLILDLRNYMHSAGVMQAVGDASAQTVAGDGEANSPLVGPVIKEETLWSCTTCGACMEQCPVMIEHVPKIADMRRHLVMERAEFPDDLQAMVRSLEARAHPYPGAQASRTDWMKGLQLADLAENPNAEFEVLFWVGCAGALNKRNQEVTCALAQVLTRAGVKFAVLGREERCTGDPARRIGYEFLFQQLARQNIETLDRFKVKTVVASCPHCFHNLKNEYPQLGGNYHVLHHSEFLEKLVAEGRLKPVASQLGTMTYHDPCYLGRYNGVYDAPRQLMASAAGANQSEPEWSRANALCCGGGGGFSFMEEKLGTRMNQNRAKQLVATGAQTVGVACPFCMIMLEDGVKSVAGDKNVQILDVAEVLERATRS